MSGTRYTLLKALFSYTSTLTVCFCVLCHVQHIIHSLQDRGVSKWVALSEGQGGTIGWLTTHERKEAMWYASSALTDALPSPDATARVHSFQLRDALHVGNIFLSESFFSCLMEEKEAIKQIRDELCRFAIVVEPAKTLFGKVRRTYTGKLGGLNDDLAITMQLCLTGLRCFYQVS